MTNYRRKILDAAERATDRTDGFCPRGLPEWMAIRDLAAWGYVKSVGIGACEDDRDEREREIFAITEAGREVLATGATKETTDGR